MSVKMCRLGQKFNPFESRKIDPERQLFDIPFGRCVNPVIAAEIELKRRAVQSWTEIGIFPLCESGYTSAVNNTSLSSGIRDKKPQE